MTPDDAPAATAESRRGPGHEAFFGRRKGKQLRTEQSAALDEVLPRLRLAGTGPIDVGSMFPVPVDRLELEIGFGGGEHLLALAADAPSTGLVGAEAFLNGLAKVAVRLARTPAPNLRLHDGDARELLDRLPDACLDRVHLYYPDPWRKRRHWKRRFLVPDNIARLARVLKPGGDLRFATDWANYAAFGLAQLRADPRFVWRAGTAADWTTPFPGWVRTRYEQKALREGRTPTYLTFERRPGVAPAPLT